MSMVIRINGKDETIEGGLTLGGLLSRKDVSPDEVVVELNGAIIARENYDSTVLNENDSLEVLRFVGGG